MRFKTEEVRKIDLSSVVTPSSAGGLHLFKKSLRPSFYPAYKNSLNSVYTSFNSEVFFMLSSHLIWEHQRYIFINSF